MLRDAFPVMDETPQSFPVKAAFHLVTGGNDGELDVAGKRCNFRYVEQPLMSAGTIARFSIAYLSLAIQVASQKVSAA